MSFTRINSWLIKSSDGYEVEILGRTGMIYRGHEGSYFVDSELNAAPNEISVFLDSMYKMTGPDRILVDSQQELVVIRKILLGLAALGLQVEILPIQFRAMIK